MSGFYELVCLDSFGFYTYYYFYSPRAIRNPKSALKNGYAPDAVRILVDDREETPLNIRFMHNPLKYVYKKYFQKVFSCGYRVNWEKEFKKYLKNT